MKKLTGFLLVIFLLSLGAASANAAKLNGWSWTETFGWVSVNCASGGDSCDTYVPGPGASTLGPYRLDYEPNWRISPLEYTDAVMQYNAGTMSKSEFDMVGAMRAYKSGSVTTGEYHGISDKYAVSIDASGNWSGYAWSEHLGWISFNLADLDSCNGSSQGHLDKTTGQVTGWAYAMVYGSTANPSDGCIELSGTNHTSPNPTGVGGITYIPSTGKLVGWAWGGDINRQTGPGWIQFNYNDLPPTNPITCTTDCPVICTDPVECGYVADNGITGSCTATPSGAVPVPSGTVVTFTATPSSGTAPYGYSWDPSDPPVYIFGRNQLVWTYTYSGIDPSYTFYPHTVKIQDKDLKVSPTYSCPTITVLNSVIPPSTAKVWVGKNVDSAKRNMTTSYTVRQNNPFALAWDITLTKDYSCTTFASPNPYPANYPNDPKKNWIYANLGQKSSGATMTQWIGDTGDGYTAGTSGKTFTPGMYQFGISCTSSKDNPPQSYSITLKVNSSSQTEI
ncbi:MAG: hypothetical protein NT077_01990 [Candidatus Taylorbacteria bacterium]|nr:hypothetical protein [Candidatus Taylorbacteria bacterium]